MIKPSSYKAPDNLLKDKVILVSGGGSGIGREAGLTFSAFGAEVILLGKNSSNLNETYSLFEKNNLKKPVLQSIDLETAKEQDYKKISEEVYKEFGKLDGLLNNASILGVKTSIQNYDFKEWRRVSKINFESALLLTRSLLPILQIPGNSSIVFTSSGVGKKGRAYWGAYAISKFATEGLVQILSEELEKTSGIRVNAINPGAVRTKMRAEAYPAEDPKNLKQPKEVMNAYLFLMGMDSLGITGNSIEAQ
ncbi:MAG: YciK family oxidoreductase [Gammaproteobacteria bacterium]|nr:MAG: YciK family oxidoreductase [Gammaproteobacteria bacterium]